MKSSLTISGSRHGRGIEALTLVAFVALFYIVPRGITPWVLAVNVAAFLIIFARAFLTPDRIVPSIPTFLSIEPLFFIFSYLIFYHPYLLFLLGLSDPSSSVYVRNSFLHGSNKAVTLATIGMYAFALGYRVLADVRDSRRSELDATRWEDANEADGISPRYFLDMVTAATAMLVALIILYLLAGWRSAGEGRYTGTTTQIVGVEGVSVAILMFCMIIAALWVYARAARIRPPLMLTVGSIAAIAWILRALSFGDRSAFLLFALTLAAGYATFVRRVSRIALLIAFAIWMSISNLIELVRFTPNWYARDDLWSLLINPPTRQTSPGDTSFNLTTITLRATVETVPYIHDYMYGIFNLIEVSSIIPFIGKLFLPFLNPDYEMSADMLTEFILGPRATWGPGTNVISDAYIDFGVPGVLVVLFLLGLSAKAIRNYVAHDRSDPQRVVIYLLAVALFAELPRYSVGLPIRTLAWALMFTALVRVVAIRRVAARGGDKDVRLALPRSRRRH